MSAIYSKELTKVSVGKACLALGITHTNEACLESLADVIRQFIESVGAQIHESSENTGRVIPGIQDVMYAIPEWKILKEFAFDDQVGGGVSSHINKKLKWREPFPYAIPPFPVEVEESPRSNVFGVQVRGDHVPSHLPTYPPLHTYKQTIHVQAKKRDAPADSLGDQKKRRIGDSKKVQMSLITLEKHAK